MGQSKRFWALLAMLAWAAPSAAADLSGGGRYSKVDIAGFLVPVRDAERLLDRGVLTFDERRQRFAFGQQIASERQLRREIKALALEDPRSLRDLYRAFKVPLPNNVAHTLTIPSGYGPAVFSNQDSKVAIGVGLGGVSRVPYRDDPDGGLGIGVSFGNSFETVGVTISASFNDLSDLDNTDRISWGIEFSRYIRDGLSIAVGGENLFVGSTDGVASYYAVGSWAFDRESGFLPFDGVLTLGAGSGRFADQTARDQFEGKSDATVIFGALAWEVSENFNVIADWNGRNLNLGVAFRVPDTPISVKFGARDLTGYSGDGVRWTGSVGLTLARF